MSKNSLLTEYGLDLAVLQHDPSGRIWYCHYCTCPLARPGEPAADTGTEKALTIERDGRTIFFRRVAPSIDHIIPQSEGGTDDLDNLVLCCRQCNSAKGGRPAWRFEAILKEWMWRHRHLMIWIRSEWEGQYVTPTLEERCYDPETRMVDQVLYNRLREGQKGTN